MNAKTVKNVPRIAQFLPGGSMLTPFIGSLWAVLHGLGQPREYADLLALSGAGNRLSWRPGEWFGGNCDIASCEDPPFAPHHRTLRAVGLVGDVRLCRPVADIDGPFVTEAEARAKIVQSIDKNMPVIAMGILGPQECCVVHGYEDGGQKLVGWNFYQADEGFPADEPFRKSDWFGNLAGYILLSVADDTPLERRSAIVAFQAIVDHAHSQDVRGAKVGLAAWEAMLHQLETATFDDCVQTMLPGPDEIWQEWAWDRTVQGRFFVYCDALCQIQERAVAIPFWERMQKEHPEWAEPLGRAIDAWRKCALYGGFLWKHLSMDEEGYKKFADPDIRKILADEGRLSMAADRRAVEAVEEILRKELLSLHA